MGGGFYDVGKTWIRRDCPPWKAPMAINIWEKTSTISRGKSQKRDKEWVGDKPIKVFGLSRPRANVYLPHVGWPKHVLGKLHPKWKSIRQRTRTTTRGQPDGSPGARWQELGEKKGAGKTLIKKLGHCADGALEPFPPKAKPGVWEKRPKKKKPAGRKVCTEGAKNPSKKEKPSVKKEDEMTRGHTEIKRNAKNEAHPQPMALGARIRKKKKKRMKGQRKNLKGGQKWLALFLGGRRVGKTPIPRPQRTTGGGRKKKPSRNPGH